MIIFEGEELLLHYHAGEGDAVFITFASADQTEKAYHQYFLQPIVQKYHLSCLGITTKIDNFYQHSDMFHIISLCNGITKKYKKIIIIGLSMAAYAALKFSAELHADIVFAMGARYTLDPAIASVCGIMQRTIDRLDPHSIAQTTIQPHEVSGKLYIAHDTYDGIVGYNAIDHEHVDKIMENLPNTVLVPVLFAHHLVINSLKGSKEFKSVLDALVTENDQKIIYQVSKIRRYHIHNIYTRILLSRDRFPLLIYKLLLSKSFSIVKNNHDIYNNRENNLLLIYNLCIKGYFEESRNLLRICFLRMYLKCNFYEGDIINKTHKTRLNVSLPALPYLIAFNRYILVFDCARNQIVAVRDFCYDPSCLPIRLYGDRFCYKVVCVWEDMVFELRMDQGEILIGALEAEDHSKDIVVVQAQENLVSLHTPDHQYCFQVDPEGSCSFKRVEHPKEWEIFAVI